MRSSVEPGLPKTVVMPVSRQNRMTASRTVTVSAARFAPASGSGFDFSSGSGFGFDFGSGFMQASFAQQSFLDRQQAGVEYVSERAEQHQCGPHGEQVGARLGVGECEADAVRRAGQQLREDHQDEGERQTQAQAREDAREGRGQEQEPESFCRGEA